MQFNRINNGVWTATTIYGKRYTATRENNGIWNVTDSDGNHLEWCTTLKKFKDWAGTQEFNAYNSAKATTGNLPTRHKDWGRDSFYLRKEFGSIIGRTIKSIRPMFEEELDGFGWYRGMDIPFVIILDDDTVIVPSQDPEGNGPGHLFIEKLGE